MKKKYIAPVTEIIAVDNEGLMERAQSWTTPDGEHKDIIPGNPTDEAKKGLWEDYDEDWNSMSEDSQNQ